MWYSPPVFHYWGHLVSSYVSEPRPGIRISVIVHCSEGISVMVNSSVGISVFFYNIVIFRYPSIIA